jgi:arylsulfatase A-like enzyme
VFVVFDELPLTILLDAGGNIDSARFPNFAALARDAYWFRNASTVASNTEHAVPAILSGRYPTAPNPVPTLRYYPVNLFTTLARHYEIRASLRFQQLCPPRACQDDAGMAGDALDSLVSDLGLVWLHIVLPRTFAEGLPAVTEDWAEFGRPRQARTGEGQYGRGGVFAEFVSAIDARPARLHFIHSMVPHMPFEYVPSGRRYRRPENENQVFRRNRMFEGAGAAYTDVLHQRHLAQAGFVDRLVGDLVSRLRQTGAYDKALVIITSDHGASYREGRSRRQPQENRNLSEILSVPLLVRVPGQQRGEVVDRIVEAVDILPTVLDLVGANASLRFDGRPLLDGRTPARASRTFVWRNRSNAELRTIGDLSAERSASVARRERRFAPGDPAALYAPPEARHLLGTDVTRAPAHAARDMTVTIRNEGQFRAVNVARDPLPLYVSGLLSTSQPEPLTVAVAVNGIVAAVTHSYRERDTHTFATLIPETSLRDGDNVVTAVVVDTPPR